MTFDNRAALKYDYTASQWTTRKKEPKNVILVMYIEQGYIRSSD